MRRRIRQLARGKFEYVKPEISISVEKMELEVIEDTDYSGEFTISSENHIPIRGLIYTTDSRMECLTSQIEGEEICVRFQFHGQGLVEGEKKTGEFVIVCNQCYKRFPYSVSVSKHYMDSSLGKIKTLYDFALLAKENWEEAYQIFYHKSFSNIIKSKEMKEKMIYKGIVSARPSNQNLEEFLVGIRKKPKIQFQVEQTKFLFDSLRESQNHSIHILKDSWGYLELNVVTEDAFIVPSRKRITTEDFLGNTYPLDVLIDYEKLHAGKNYGTLLIQSVYHTEIITYEVSKKKNHPDPEQAKLRQEIKEYKVGIMELYQAFRLKRMVTGVWANETIEILNHLYAICQEETLYLLMKAQVLIINRQRQEAEWILDDFKRTWKNHKDPMWGYYLYLLTLLEREPSYVDRMTQEIEMIFHDNPDSVFLFWILSFLEEEYYNNSAHKLKAIEYWLKKGCTSPYLYLEAYYLIWQEPYLLTKLGKIQLRVLRWAVRQHALTKDLAEQIFSIVEASKQFDDAVYRILCAAYEVDPKPAYIGIICSYLIKGQQYGKRFHHWFEQGIELELRITGLYEAYLMSLDEREVQIVPKIIQMYFQYESRLSYRKMAVLYHNIIAGKNTNPDMYHKYRKAIGRFAMEQVELGHIDDNLAVLYQDMLDSGLINEEIAHSLAKILFTNKLVVMDDHMVRAYIYQRQLKEPQIVPITDKTAYIQLYSREYVVVFEDAGGRRFVGSIDYQMQNLMNPERYMPKCMELASDELPYIIAYFDKKQNYLTFRREDKQYFGRILFGHEFSTAYEAEIVLEIIRFYRTCASDGTITRYLREADLIPMPAATRRYLLDLLIENRIYDKAYELVELYGCDQIGAAAKVALSSYMIQKFAYEEEAFLVELALQGFMAGKYNDVMLEYLSKYYVGPIETMRDLWKADGQFEIEDTFDLEERMLLQMLYAEQLLPEADDIFHAYCESGGRDWLNLAYLSYRAHEYFLNDTKSSEYIFSQIENYYVKKIELNDACKLALLKHLSERSGITQVQFEIEDELLAEYTCRNMNFAFYKKLDPRLVTKYHFYDKVFLEYRANPRKHVVLHYSRDEDGVNFVAEDMPDVYDGIFVKIFVMFFGDMVQYYISEEYKSQVQVTESNRICNNDIYRKKDESRYNLINQMLISNTLLDDDTLCQNMKQYRMLEEITTQKFKLL